MTTQRDLKATTPRLRRTPPTEGNNTPPLRGTPPQEGNKGAIQCATEFFAASVHAASDHFRGVTKLIVHGKVGESVVNHWLTTAADGNLSAIPTGTQYSKQRRPCHG